MTKKNNNNNINNNNFIKLLIIIILIYQGYKYQKINDKYKTTMKK